MNTTVTIARGEPQHLQVPEYADVDCAERQEMQALAHCAAPQHMQALARANEVRLARAEIKRRVMEGDTTAAKIILDLPSEVASMAVSELLMSQHRWGHTRARRFLATIPMTETKTIGSLTDRQRFSLADMLAAQAPSPRRRLGAPSTA
jgi:hypothetical protein